MKTEIIKPAPVFVPVTISLTFESQEELDNIGLLFNQHQIVKVFNLRQARLFEVFELAGANISKNFDAKLSELKAEFRVSDF